MHYKTAYAELREDGLLDVTFYGADGIPIARAEGYRSGEEATIAFREYMEQLEAERKQDEYQEPEEVGNPSIPG